MDEILYLTEDAYGANGDLNRADRIERCAQRQLVYIYEALAEHDDDDPPLKPDNLRLAEWVSRRVARAMVDVFDGVTEERNTFWTDIINDKA